MQPPLPRRIKAAMELAGYESADALAEAIGEYGLGASTLRKFLREERRPRRLELQTIATACHVPYEFFTAPDIWANWTHQPDAQIDAIQAGLDLNTAMIRVGLGMLAKLVPNIDVPTEFTAGWEDVARAGAALAEAHRELSEGPDSAGNPGSAR